MVPKGEAIKRLQQQIDRIGFGLVGTGSREAKFAAWKRTTEMVIEQIFGRKSRQIEEFREVGNLRGGVGNLRFSSIGAGTLLNLDEAEYRPLLQSFIDEINYTWEDEDLTPKTDAKDTEIDSHKSMVVEPIFGLPNKLANPFDLFVVMPFLDELKPVYTDHISQVARRLELTVFRGDDFFTAASVVSDIWDAICSARAIIADCTGRNPNVFYEIGLAHVLGKPVILITQNRDDVPFDVTHLRYIRYQMTRSGMNEFEARLERTIRTALRLGISSTKK